MANAMPKVKVYPLCSECRAPYVLRRAFVLNIGKQETTGGARWIWQRDCKHKKAVPLSSASPRLKGAM